MPVARFQMSKSALSHLPEQRPEAVIAGTLSLMSCYVQHPVALYAERVTANLDLRRACRLCRRSCG